MFRKRSGQKPDEVLIRDFQNQFGHVATTPYNPDTGVQPDHIVTPNASLQALPTFDPNPTSFPRNPTFASSPLSRQNCSCTVFKSRMCAVLHSPAGDLHTPMHECDAVPASTSPWGPALDGQQGGHDGFHANDAYQLEYFRRPTFPWRSSNPFIQQPTHSPKSFMLHDPNPDLDPLEPLTDTQFAHSQPRAPYTQSSPFRYQVILHTPTATFNKECEIPVTYLNRRQAYKISVVDTAPPINPSSLVRYRTHIRISFDDDKQRADPVAAWKLWIEGRGLTEARETHGKLAAVEFVDTKPNPVESVDKYLELESSSIDGFCVAWTSDPQAGRLGCEMHVVFNFLSTDFSLSKGVKGAPLRLCAKTEVVSDSYLQSQPNVSVPEICCCKVKLFRDHGSERKIANDIIQLKKAIQRVEESIAHSTADGRNASKRKRGKLPLVARGSESSVQQLGPSDLHNAPGLPGTDTLAVEEDPHKVLLVLRAMLSSSQPYSFLSLPGDEHDDPDKFPILLPNFLPDSVHPERSLTGTDFSSQWGPLLSREHAQKKPFASGAAHTHFMTSMAGNPIIPDAGRQSIANLPVTTINIPMRSRVGNHQRAVACFYVIRRTDGQHEAYHHAVYLRQRTLSEFIKQLSRINNIPPESVIRVVRVNAAGLRILVDDNVVRETPEGQDMVAEFLPGDDTTAPGSSWQVNLFY